MNCKQNKSHNFQSHVLQTQKMYSWPGIWINRIYFDIPFGIPSIFFIQWTLPNLTKRKYFDKYILTGYWDKKMSLGNGSVVYAPLLCPMHKNRCIVSSKNITTFVLENSHFGQIYFVFWTNKIGIFDKYILYFGQIYFVFGQI